MTLETVAGRPGAFSTRAPEGYDTAVRMTGEGAFITESLSGEFAERNYRGNVFSFGVSAVTVPVNANNLVSVCGIYNPPGSGVILEMIDTDVSLALATTVVQTFVIVSSTAAASALATFTTAGTALSRRLQDSTNSDARVYTAVTHSGTPTVSAHIGGYGATTSPGMQMYRKWNGTLMIPPGILASVATLTAASTASGINIHFSWAEVPAS